LAYITQIRRLARTTRGVSGEYMRRLYMSVAVSKILFGASIWITPTSGGARGSNMAIRRLTRIHRQAAILITGAMKTTATDVLEAHANLPPFKFIVERICMRDAVRLATLPETHVLYGPVKRAGKKYIKRLRSPLHEIMNAFKVQPTKMEKIKSIRHLSNWRPTVTPEVWGDKDDVKERIREETDNNPDRIWIYTDGSAHNGGVGAAAVMYKGKDLIDVKRQYLGTDKEHTVYEAEAIGLALGIGFLGERIEGGDALLGLDNQAIQLGLVARKGRTAGYIMDEVNDMLQRLKYYNRNINVRIIWTPGHIDIPGNERADGEAKKAAEGNSTPHNHLPASLLFLPISAAATRQSWSDKLKQQAAHSFSKSPRAQQALSIDPSLPSKSYLKLTRPLRRKQTALITQLRTGHVPLNKHLHTIGLVESPICPGCNEHAETVYHYIMRCPTYENQRNTLYAQLGRHSRSLRTLLNTDKAIPHLLRFVRDTGRLEDTFGRDLIST
jgi:ribonuclease HI